MREESKSVLVSIKSTTTLPTSCQSASNGRSYSDSPCPGPSIANVAKSLSRNNCSVDLISSLVESSPLNIITTGGFFTPFGFLKIPGISKPLYLMVTRSPTGFK